MKKFISKILLTSCLVIAWISSIPTITLAKPTEKCNAFWQKCHVEDINTIKTDDETVSDDLLDTIKKTINRILAILATVTLCVVMYWWFKMLTSGWDSKWYDAGWKILKNALIWLAIILLAWMIVSVVFWFVGTMSDDGQTQSAWT